MAYTKDEFAERIKAKYPAYANVDNNVLVDRVLEKYPVYKSQVSFEQPKPTPQPKPQPKPIPTPKTTPKVQTQTYQTPVDSDPISAQYDVIANDSTLSKKQKIAKMNELKMSIDKDINKQKRKDITRVSGGALLQGISTLPIFNIPVVGTALGGGMFDAGSAIMEGKSGKDIAKQAGRGAAIGATIEAIPYVGKFAGKTKAGQAVIGAASKAGQKLAETGVGKAVGKAAAKTGEVLNKEIPTPFTKQKPVVTPQAVEQVAPQIEQKVSAKIVEPDNYQSILDDVRNNPQSEEAWNRAYQYANENPQILDDLDKLAQVQEVIPTQNVSKTTKAKKEIDLDAKEKREQAFDIVSNALGGRYKKSYIKGLLESTNPKTAKTREKIIQEIRESADKVSDVDAGEWTHYSLDNYGDEILGGEKLASRALDDILNNNFESATTKYNREMQEYGEFLEEQAKQQAQQQLVPETLQGNYSNVGASGKNKQSKLTETMRKRGLDVEPMEYEAHKFDIVNEHIAKMPEQDKIKFNQSSIEELKKEGVSGEFAVSYKLNQLFDEYNNTGKINSYVLNNMRKNGTQAGQEVAAYKNIAPDNPIGVAVKFNQMVMDKAPNDAKKLIDSADEIVKKVNAQQSKFAKMVGNTAVSRKELTEKQLAERDMLDTLYSIAKGVLPERVPTPQRSIFKTLRNAILNPKKYQKTYDKAIEQLSSAQPDNPYLSRFLNSYLEKPFTENQIKKAVNQTLKENGMTAKDVTPENINQLAEYFSQQVGALKDTAMRNAFEDNLTLLANKNADISLDQKQKAIERLLADKKVAIHKRKTIMDKILELDSYGGLNSENLTKLINKEYKIPELNTSDMSQIQKYLDIINDSNVEKYPKEVAKQLMMQLMVDKTPPTIMQKAVAAKNIAMLLNFKTLERNIIGNTIFNAIDTGAKELANLIDTGMSWKTGVKTRSNVQYGAMGRGFKEGLKKGYNEALMGINTRGLTQKYDFQRSNVFKSKVGNSLEKALRIGLQVPDRAFYEAIYAESVANQMKARGLKKLSEVTDDIFDQADLEALEGVLQNDSLTSRAALGVRNMLNFGKEAGIGNYVIPFAQTPANLFEQGVVNYSPLGLIKGAKNYHKGNQRQASLDIARSLLGTTAGAGALAGGYYGLVQPHLYDNNYQKNARIRANKELLGQRPDSIGGVYYSPFQPTSTTLSPYAQIGYNLKQYGLRENLTDEEQQELLMKTLIGAGNTAVGTLTDLPMMQNFSGVYNDINRGDMGGAFARLAGNMVSQHVPSLVKNVAENLDEYQRETYDRNKLLMAKNQVQAKIPGLRNLLPEKYDVKGQPKKLTEAETIQGKVFDTYFNPTYLNKPKDDMVIQELESLYDITGETKHLLPVAQRTISYKGETKKLNNKELSQYQKELGTRIYNEMENRITRGSYKNMSAEKKVKKLEEIVKRNTEKVKRDLFFK